MSYAEKERLILEAPERLEQIRKGNVKTPCLQHAEHAEVVRQV